SSPLRSMNYHARKLMHTNNQGNHRSRSQEGVQEKEIDAFFQDPSDQRSTKFIEKLRESEIISDDSSKTYNEEDENYIPSNTGESTSDASEDNDDLDYNNDYENENTSPKVDKAAFCKAHDAIPNTTKSRLSTGKIVE
ncbi:909_t:CDS:2, partial [Ambispora gerdemannii]